MISAFDVNRLARAGVVMTALHAFASVARAQSDTLPPMPPPGRLVDLGGWRLHLDDIMIDAPEVTIAAIRDVLAATRR